MIDYIKSHIARYSKRVPNDTTIKINLIRKLEPDIYSHDSFITVSTINVMEAIKILKYANSVNWDTEYAMSRNAKLSRTRTIFISKWYSINGNFIDKEVFYSWLSELSKCYDRYLIGINMKISTRSHMNSVKLKLLITEAESIMNMILVKNGYKLLN